MLNTSFDVTVTSLWRNFMVSCLCLLQMTTSRHRHRRRHHQHLPQYLHCLVDHHPFRHHPLHHHLRRRHHLHHPYHLQSRIQ